MLLLMLMLCVLRMLLMLRHSTTQMRSPMIRRGRIRRRVIRRQRRRGLQIEIRKLGRSVLEAVVEEIGRGAGARSGSCGGAEIKIFMAWVRG